MRSLPLAPLTARIKSPFRLFSLLGDSYSRDLYAPDSNCEGAIGTEVDLSSGPDLNKTLITGGGGLNQTKLALRKTTWGTCIPVQSHDYIRTNTIFEVARQNGLVTAYADKHLSYSFVNGPSGIGLTEVRRSFSGFFSQPFESDASFISVTGFYPELASVAANDVARMGWDDQLVYRAIEPVLARREGTGEEPIAESREGRPPDQVL